jgi:hypothetical protein
MVRKHYNLFLIPLPLVAAVLILFQELDDTFLNSGSVEDDAADQVTDTLTLKINEDLLPRLWLCCCDLPLLVRAELEEMVKVQRHRLLHQFTVLKCIF